MRGENLPAKEVTKTKNEDNGSKCAKQSGFDLALAQKTLAEEEAAQRARQAARRRKSSGVAFDEEGSAPTQGQAQGSQRVLVAALPSARRRSAASLSERHAGATSSTAGSRGIFKRRTRPHRPREASQGSTWLKLEARSHRVVRSCVVRSCVVVLLLWLAPSCGGRER